MKGARAFLVLTACAVIVYVLVSCSDKGPVPATNSEAPGASGAARPAVASAPLAPNFALQTLDNRTVTLDAYRGKIVVLNFWATWCPPCRYEIPDFIAAQKRYRDKGIEFIGIALDEDGREAVAPFVQEQGINYTVVLGEPKVLGKVVESYGGIQGIPTTFFIDREGRIQERVNGAIYGDDLETMLKQMLAAN